MKKNLFFLVLMPLIIFSGCNDCDCDDDCNQSKNRVLMLKVDYATNQFEEGIEYVFDQKTDSFTLDVILDWDSTSGTFLINYKEINETILFGTISLFSPGEILSPTSMHTPEYFETIDTEDILFPKNGFTMLSVSSQSVNFEAFNVWLSVQRLKKVRNFLRSNPEQKIKIFIYSPNGPYTNTPYGNYLSKFFIFIQN